MRLLGVFEFVDISDLHMIEKAASKTLETSVVVDPRYPEQSLCDECYPTIWHCLLEKLQKSRCI